MPLPGELAALAERVSNWGRWGPDDERGTVNLIDAAAVQRGLAAAREGKTYSLALPLEERGLQHRSSATRQNPKLETYAVNEPFGSVAFSDDKVTTALQAATHWDALAHVSYDGLLYNGFPAEAITPTGTTRCGIDAVGAVVTRGVLLDVARAHGAERLDPSHGITGDDLEAAAALGALTVEPGDVVLLRTGQMQHWLGGDRSAYWAPSPGPVPGCVEWLREHDVAAIATDNGTFELMPDADGGYDMPVHGLLLRDVGMIQGQNWNLEELAADCHADGAYEFLLSASPEPFTGACGAPVHPVAIK